MAFLEGTILGDLFGIPTQRDLMKQRLAEQIQSAQTGTPSIPNPFTDEMGPEIKPFLSPQQAGILTGLLPGAPEYVGQQLLKAATPQQAMPISTPGKEQFDVKRGFLTQDQLDKRRPGGMDREPRVQSSQIMAGGLVQLVMDDGSIRIVTPKIENAQKIRDAEQRAAELQGIRSGERASGTASIKASVSAFTDLATARKSIGLIDEAIEALNAGAQTGTVMSKLPSVQEASKRLDNIQSRMGLNVIQNTTFGSLSEAELAFALSAALPQNLSGPELMRWLQEKREAQNKLAEYLEEAAIFLGQPGNDISTFLAQKRAMRNQAPNTIAPLSGQRPPLSSFER